MGASHELVELRAIARLRAKDPSLFTFNDSAADKISTRLGWIGLADKVAHELPRIRELANAALADGVTDIALLGMGGSSLASLVMGAVLGAPKAALHVLDTTSPITVRKAMDALDPATTLYVVASKSGGTIEPNTLYSIFREQANSVLGAQAAGQRFVAITDPGSSLEALAARDGFLATIGSPADVGGRFSAMSVFGMVPAALAGFDVERLVQRAAEAELVCASPDAENPAVQLASFLMDSVNTGADKLTFVAHDEWTTFGLWVEQLIAESLGKNGKGIVPLVEYSDNPRGYGPDRALAVMRASGDEKLAEWAASRRGIHPVHEIVLDDPYDVAEQFVVWEYAIALCGALLGVNPFDEPNVAEAKAATEAVLQGSAEAPEAQIAVNGVHLTFAGSLSEPEHLERSVSTAVGHALAALGQGEYLAVLAYLPDDPALLDPLKAELARISAKTGAAVCFELGPRYLHSTGQLYKGGPHTGVYVMITTRDAADVAVPLKPWGLGALHVSQAEGDLTALAAHGRRVLRLDLPDASEVSVGLLALALAESIGG